MLKPYIEGVKEIAFYKPYTLREKIKEILPNHILYDLRTTFYSRCIECGVADVAQKRNAKIKMWFFIVGNVYTLFLCLSNAKV
jgi:hypothetical protein